jgi:hypothetical protein
VFLLFEAASDGECGASMLANILGCGVASLLVKYLGLPLGASIASD